MRVTYFAIAATIGLSSFAQPRMAIAQSAPQSRPLNVTFSGVVANEITNTIKVRQPDGSFSTFTGPVPDYPYKRGDAVTISFNTTMPTQAYYGQSYQGQVAADGIYRINIAGPNSAGGGSAFGRATDFDVSGPIRPVANAGQQLGFSGMTIVYDSNADTYSLDLPRNTWSASLFDAPGYNYDPASGTLTASNTSCSDGAGGSCERTGDGGFRLSGDQTSVSTGNIPIYNLAGASPQNLGVTGFFSALFSGSWNLPFTSSPTGPVDVPEPSMLMLFGAGSAALLWRRRRKAVRSV